VTLALLIFAAVLACCWLVKGVWLAATGKLTRLEVILYVVLPSLGLLFIVAWLGFAAAGVVPSRGSPGLRRSPRAQLHNCGLGIAMYVEGHGGAYPPDLETVADEGHLESESLSEWAKASVIYIPPAAQAPADTVLAFSWPPHRTKAGEGTNVLYKDGTVEWVTVDEQGRLVNPRTGDLIRPTGEPAR
jgi:hypothetical protein